ncbi:flagellar basal body-associated protein FliL [Vibrio sp. JC009]|uniref:flagellar basal body-associated protein FliL n=1 Tax=Vibrio sp. JC009 TaxID=2912314 RepID=UPI0023B139EB|nr:flagellar basal body-associated protein FliL [Vibrio sp. JC009]WED21745.1 flagellar basal body-associated protein FliL [Vibrio sp. JC009]
MLRPYFVLLILALCSTFSTATLAEEEEAAGPNFAYYTLAPDLTTNIHTQGKKIGYLQVRIDLMVSDNAFIPDLELHDPLIRDTVISVIGEQPEDKIKSLAGREQLRKDLMDRLNSILLAETGRTIIAELLFTKYLYQ